jgi:tRNA A-37 threonylcarbamoyl transferase component Bud32
MEKDSLERLTISELRQMAEKMDLEPSRRKGDLIQQIRNAFNEWENYKKEKVERYEKIKSLGNKGREAVAFLVYDHKHKKEYAQKQYRKNKSSTAIRREYEFQKKASERGISPKVVDCDTISKTITMEKMEYDLIDLIQKQKGKLTRKQQEDILKLFDGLDNLGIFHADSNSLNLMYTTQDELKIIDYGFAEEITPRIIKKYGTDKPNRLYLTMGLISQLKRIFPESKFIYLEKTINPELLDKFMQANPPPQVK